MKRLLKKPHIFWIIGIFLIYMAINILISQFYVTIQFIPHYLETIKWPVLILSAALSITIGILISISTVYLYIRYQERRSAKNQGALVCAAAIGGLATGICSVCVAGIVPLLFSFLGITFSFGALPFKGMEIQSLIIIILLASLYSLNKK